MKLKRLRKKIRRQSFREYRAGRINEQQYLHCMYVAGANDAILRKLNSRIENEVNPWNRADGLIGASWSGWLSNAWDWFVANWPKILNIILTIAPLLLEPEYEDSQPLAKPPARPLQRQQRRVSRDIRRRSGDGPSR